MFTASFNITINPSSADTLSDILHFHNILLFLFFRNVVSPVFQPIRNETMQLSFMAQPDKLSNYCAAGVMTTTQTSFPSRLSQNAMNTEKCHLSDTGAARKPFDNERHLRNG